MISALPVAAVGQSRRMAGSRPCDGLVVPGGVANPDQLRIVEDVQRFVRAFFEQGKPVRAICHGPWTLIDAGVADGRTLTSWPSRRPTCATRGPRGSTRRS
jgi:protease I